MVLPILGALILLGIVGFIQVKPKDGRRPMWHWIALVLSTIFIIAIIALWVGEYRFESAHRLHLPN